MFSAKGQGKNMKVETADVCKPEMKNIKAEETDPKQLNKYNNKNKGITNSLERLFQITIWS